MSIHAFLWIGSASAFRPGAQSVFIDQIGAAGDLRHRSVRERIRIESFRLLPGIDCFKAPYFFAIVAIITVDPAAVLIHPRSDQIHPELLADRRQQKLRRCGDNNVIVPALSKIPVPQTMLVLLPESLDHAVYVRYFRQKGEKPC